MTPTHDGEIIRARVKHVAVFGLFFDFVDPETELLLLIPEISWIASLSSCEQIADVGDEFEMKILHHDSVRRKIAASIRAIYPENNPWDGSWHLRTGDQFEAEVVRWVNSSNRCGNQGGYLLALRPGALVMLCGHYSGRWHPGDLCNVVVTAIDEKSHDVSVELVP